MKLISAICLLQLVKSKTHLNSDDLISKISHKELLNIREKYCQSVKLDDKNSEFCQTANDLPERPDWVPPGFLLLVWSLVREANELCEIYYEEFHGINDFSLVNNTYVAAGGQGMVFKCECFQEGVQPAITAQKVYYTVADKDITEMKTVGYALSEAGIRAPLYWFHAAGYFEEFLGHKKDMWEHSTGVRIDDEQVLRKTAKNLAELHQVAIDGIDKEKYAKPFEFGSGFWNTREIKHFFAYLETIFAYTEAEQEKNKANVLNALGMTLEEYNWNIEWIENLVRNYHKDEEIAVVSHNDPHAGNMMMDRNDTTAESLILIDWDLTQYGFRAFDLAYHMYYASFVRIFDIGGDYDPESPEYPDIEVDDYFMPDEVIEEFLVNYLVDSGDTTTTIEEMTTEFNIHTTYIIFMQVVFNTLYDAIDLRTFQWGICKLEELQKLFNHPDPINCVDFPFNRPNCDECESILVDCIMNCGGDPACTSTCNRDHAACLESCK